jgi:Xaa-Pro aminopeptidase
MIYNERIKLIQKILKVNEVLVLFAAENKIRNRDVEYKFRQDSDYYYLTGIEEPEGILVIKNNSVIHFCLPKDKEKEIWTGIRLGKDKIKEILNLKYSYNLNDWNKKKESILTNIHTLFYFFGKVESRDREILNLCSALNNKLRDGKFGPLRIEIPEFLHELRMTKDRTELEIIKEAVSITANGHIALMKKTRTGMYEYELESILESEYLKAGSWGGGYGHIVATGKNATILHYTTNNSMIKDGDLILVDSGAEINYYTADVTRVYPANKKFTETQKDIYELVLDSQINAISLTIEGTKFKTIHEATVRILIQGLKDLKLLKGSIDSIIENQTYKKFYMHKTGHWLGMDVHDVGRYYIDGESRALRNGQITTVEPGLYFDPSDSKIPAHFRGIGIRIEDDILVNGNNPINLTESIPKSIKEIEYLRK